jgi:hypothetical protein
MAIIVCTVGEPSVSFPPLNLLAHNPQCVSVCVCVCLKTSQTKPSGANECIYNKRSEARGITLSFSFLTRHNRPSHLYTITTYKKSVVVVVVSGCIVVLYKSSLPFLLIVL